MKVITNFIMVADIADYDKDTARYIESYIERQAFFVWTRYSLWANGKHRDICLKWCLLTMCPIDVALSADFTEPPFTEDSSLFNEYMFRNNKINNGLPLGILEYHEYMKQLFYEKFPHEEE